MQPNTPQQYCLNCQKEVAYAPRYPKYICATCCSLLTDKEGRKVVYYNTEALGTGCQGYYTDSNLKELYNSPYCYIDQQKYIAEEGRFGGIVISKCD